MTEWERCKPWIEAALVWTRGTHSIEDVEALIEQGDAIFWPGARSAAVTEIIQHPSGLKTHHMWLCGGDMDEIVNAMLPVAEAHGILHGCTRFTTAGRPGWRKVLAAHGYQIWYESCLKELQICQ